jgi:ParB-like chromosome segregation protein Spo0J
VLNTPYTDLLPPLSTDELEALRNDIAAHGVLSPVVIDEDGNILDGHHRYKIDPTAPTTTIAELSEVEKLAYIYRSNFARRNLSPEQKARKHKQMKEVARRLNDEGRTQEEIGALLGVAQNTASVWLNNISNINDDNTYKTHTDQRIKLKKEHIEEIVERVDAGETQAQVGADFGISQARVSQTVNREHKKQENKQAAEQMAAKAIVETQKAGLEPNTIKVCDIYDLELPADCADLIFTDPPYHDEYIELYARLAVVAAHALKPGAYLMTYAGKMYLPQLITILGVHLEYVWTYCVFQPDNNQRVMVNNIFEAWRPILCFKKPGETLVKGWQPDAIKGTRNKDYHEWQQQIEPALKYIEAYTPVGGLVVDPFIGGGTTAAASKQLARHYAGFDKDEDTVSVALGRVSQ